LIGTASAVCGCKAPSGVDAGRRFSCTREGRTRPRSRRLKSRDPRVSQENSNRTDPAALANSLPTSAFEESPLMTSACTLFGSTRFTRVLAISCEGYRADFAWQLPRLRGSRRGRPSSRTVHAITKVTATKAFVASVAAIGGRTDLGPRRARVISSVSHCSQHGNHNRCRWRYHHCW